MLLNLEYGIFFIVVNEWISSFEAKILPFLNMKVIVDDAEAIKLGKKSQDEYPFVAVLKIMWLFCHYFPSNGLRFGYECMFFDFLYLL